MHPWHQNACCEGVVTFVLFPLQPPTAPTTCWQAAPSSPPRHTVTAPHEPSAWRRLYHRSPTPSYTAEQAGSGALTDQLPVCGVQI